jgi:hypothetical protein
MGSRKKRTRLESSSDDRQADQEAQEALIRSVIIIWAIGRKEPSLNHHLTIVKLIKRLESSDDRQADQEA